MKKQTADRESKKSHTERAPEAGVPIAVESAHRENTENNRLVNTPSIPSKHNPARSSRFVNSIQGCMGERKLAHKRLRALRRGSPGAQPQRPTEPLAPVHAQQLHTQWANRHKVPTCGGQSEAGGERKRGTDQPRNYSQHATYRVHKRNATAQRQNRQPAMIARVTRIRQGSECSKGARPGMWWQTMPDRAGEATARCGSDSKRSCQAEHAPERPECAVCVRLLRVPPKQAQTRQKLRHENNSKRAMSCEQLREPTPRRDPPR